MLFRLCSSTKFWSVVSYNTVDATWKHESSKQPLCESRLGQFAHLELLYLHFSPFQTRLITGTQGKKQFKKYTRHNNQLYLPCTVFSSFPHGCIDTVELKFKKHLWRHKIIFFLYQKNKYTVCCIISICTKHTKMSSSTQCTSTTAGPWLIPDVGDADHCFFFFLLFLFLSGVAVVVDPSGHPLLGLSAVQLDFPVLGLGRILFDSHGVVAGDAVILARSLEESALGRWMRG